VLGLQPENLARLPEEPIAFEPAKDLVPLFFEHGGRRIQVDHVFIVSGKELEWLIEQARAEVPDWQPAQRVRLADGREGHIEHVRHLRDGPSRRHVYTLDILLDDGTDVRGVPIDGVRKVTS
jgi:hypothetical protein